MPVKRIFITWLHFACAVFTFCVVNRVLGNQYPLKTSLMAFTGWTSIGNSNWYVFAALCTYIFTWIAFAIFYKKPKLALILTTMLLVGYIIVVHSFRPEEWYWYNTILCYGAGMWYSYFREKIEKNLFDEENPNNYYIALFVSVMAVFLLSPYRGENVKIYIVWTLWFTVMAVLMTMKIAIHNKILYWLGMYTFEIYILQRIPMMIFARWWGIRNQPCIFLIFSIAGTLILASVFKKLYTYMDKKILSFFKI